MRKRVIGFEGVVEDCGTLSLRQWRKLKRELSDNPLVRYWSFDFEWDSSQKRIKGMTVFGLVWADFDLGTALEELETALASYDVAVVCDFEVERENSTTGTCSLNSGFTPPPLPEGGLILRSNPVDEKRQREIEEIHQAVSDLLRKAATY